MRVDKRSGARLLAQTAVASLAAEAELSPKPGLVDARGSGSHGDMSLDLMLRSAQTLEPYFLEMAQAAWGRKPSQALREEIGWIGRCAEAAMMEATQGVNTHRGAIWSLGLLVSSAALRKLQGSEEKLFSEASLLARLRDRGVRPTVSHGETVRSLYGCFGAREEAQFGFPHIRHFGLRELRHGLKRNEPRELSEINSLLAVLSDLHDTCILFRGGVQALQRAQKECREILRHGGIGTPKGETVFCGLDDWMRAHRLSPGGAADLLAGTLFTHRVTAFIESRSRVY